jgi:hypothetical protein
MGFPPHHRFPLQEPRSPGVPPVAGASLMISVPNYSGNLVFSAVLNATWTWRGSKRQIELPKDDLEAARRGCLLGFLLLPVDFKWASLVLRRLQPTQSTGVLEPVTA